MCSRLATCPARDAPLPDILGFALTYNGYDRLGSGPDALVPIVQPVLEAMRVDGQVPEWAGLDLLRGTLFWVQRLTHHWGDVPPAEEALMRDLVEAISARASEDYPLTYDPSV